MLSCILSRVIKAIQNDLQEDKLICAKKILFFRLDQFKDIFDKKKICIISK